MTENRQLAFILYSYAHTETMNMEESLKAIEEQLDIKDLLEREKLLKLTHDVVLAMQNQKDFNLDNWMSENLI